MTEAERKLVASIAAHESWASTPDRAARTAPARRALEAKFLELAGETPVEPSTCARLTTSASR